jgi:uncharacterized protein YeaO (DUF488 family)
MKNTFAIKRIYDSPAPSDGYRVLIDRLWPRGVSKERAAVDLWLKEVAPSPDLRNWFHYQGPDSFQEFSTRYTTELMSNPTIAKLNDLAGAYSRVTLLFAAHDPIRNHAQVLLKYLQN